MLTETSHIGDERAPWLIEVAHEGGAGIAADHPLGRAAHVDVDDPGAGRFRDTGCFRHPARLAAGELDDMRFDARPFRPQLGLLRTLDKLVGCNHLGDDEACAQTLDDPAVGDIRDARERRKDRRRFDPYWTDAEAAHA